MLQRRTSKITAFFTAASIITAVVAALVVVPSEQVFAKSSGAADGLQISPVLVELNADPGRTYTVRLSLTNVTASDLTFDSFVNDFKAKDESGAPVIDLKNESPATASIRSWVEQIGSTSIDSRKSVDVIATINVPADAEPGGHYGVIRFSGRAPDIDGVGVGLSASVGTLLLVRVSGEINESLDVKEFFVSQNEKQSSFFERGPIVITTRFVNTGNVHVKPIGQVVVRDMLGRTVSTVTVNQTKGNVLPDSIRRFDMKFDNSLLFGRYTADLSVAYGTKGQAIVRTISFWVVPWKLLLLIIIGVATLVFILVQLVKRYNRYIIAKATKQKHETKQKTTKKKK